MDTTLISKLNLLAVRVLRVSTGSVGPLAELCTAFDTLLDAMDEAIMASLESGAAVVPADYHQRLLTGIRRVCDGLSLISEKASRLQLDLAASMAAFTLFASDI